MIETVVKEQTRLTCVMSKLVVEGFPETVRQMKEIPDLQETYIDDFRQVRYCTFCFMCFLLDITARVIKIIVPCDLLSTLLTGLYDSCQ